MASCSTLSLILIALLRASMYIINSLGLRRLEDPCRGIERDEGGTTMGETGGGAESELEGLFEEETTKDHEVVSISDRWGHGTVVASATWRE
ncbi:hypothetical protein KCU83_g38, partial [Aureobasidium melanogenum]